MKRFGIFIAVIFIGSVIWFIEFRKVDEIVTSSGERITTGIVATNNSTVGKNIGDSAPNWILLDFDGEVIELEDYRGRPVMLDFFADWCPFCHTEFPFIEAAHKMYATEGLVVIGVHRTDTESLTKGRSFALEAGATFTLVQDTKGDVYGRYSSGPAMPISFFIDANGIIRDKILGPKTPVTLEQGISTIVERS